MHDIRLALFLMGLLSLCVFVGLRRLLRNRSKRFLDFFATVLLGLTFAYTQLVWGQLWIVRWIPLPSVIVLSNWYPLILAAFAATVWLRLEPAPISRRMPIMVVMLIAGIASALYFIPTEPPECGDDWRMPIPPAEYPVCLQTTKYTCSAASSATILNTLGIEATEQEMAELCMTRRGTTWLGLYHGLSTKLLGTQYRVDFFEAEANTLVRVRADAPLLLCCRLDPDVAEAAPEYVTQGGWIPGTAHSVVYFGVYRGLHIIGDPSQGYETWTNQDLDLLWTGSGLCIRRISPQQ